MNTQIYDTINDIKDVINNNTNKVNFNLQKSDVYQDLIQKEDKILNILNDIDTKERESKYEYILNAPLHMIVKTLFKTLLEISSELYRNDDIVNLTHIFFKKERIIYTGIILVLIAIILILIKL